MEDFNIFKQCKYNKMPHKENGQILRNHMQSLFARMMRLKASNDEVYASNPIYICYF